MSGSSQAVTGNRARHPLAFGILLWHFGNSLTPWGGRYHESYMVIYGNAGVAMPGRGESGWVRSTEEASPSTSQPSLRHPTSSG
jgi:hypothetical protein